MTDADVVVVGAGPNGLAAACRLARAGLRVRVIEAADAPGGGLRSLPLTRPGFVHDRCAGFVTFRDSVAFEALNLPVEYRYGELQSTHPAPDGTVAAISTDVEVSARHFGSPEDGETVRELVAFHRRVEPTMLALTGSLPQVAPLLRMSPVDAVRLGLVQLRRPAAWARATFRSEAARRVVPAMGGHVDVGPDDPLGMPICWMLAFRAFSKGYAIPRGGMGALADALVADLEAHGGAVTCGARVVRFLLAGGRARGVVLADGTEVRARAVVADLHARTLFLDLLGRWDVPAAFRRSIEAFRPGWGVFKLDWALSGPVPWADPLSGRSAVVHVTDSLADLARFTAQVRAGRLPDHPYLVVGQQSLADDTRAPPGQHTLYAYTHAPFDLAGGWAAAREGFADRIEARLEGLAPGFRGRVLARAIHDPTDLQRTNANLVGGDLGGGSNAWHHSFFLRPTIRGFRHRTPIGRLYLASASTHPGAGVHGMGGWNAAERVLEDLG